MKRRNSKRGFSLLEVVIATGLCAGAIAAVLAMVPPLLAALAESGQRTVALRCAGTLEARWRTAPWPEVLATVGESEAWYADVSGSRIGTAEDAIWTAGGATPAARNGLKRFELVAIRDDGRSSSAVLVYSLVVRWPAFTGDGQPVTDRSRQQSLVLVAARNR